MNPSALPAAVIFTDLDGTLLELETYSCQPVQAVVAQLEARRIPIVFCSSKTRAEQEVYHRKLRVAAPFIVENGAAIFIPKGYFGFDYAFQKLLPQYDVLELGVVVSKIRPALAEIRAQLGLSFYGYADLSLAEICQLTGLDQASAKRAMQREYSETILKADFNPHAWQRFQAALQSKQLAGVSGSRFFTITSANSHKGRAVQILADMFRRQLGKIMTIGLGDSPNDAPMLAVVDKPFLVQKPGGQWAELDVPHIKISGIGPQGWRKAVFELF